MRAIHLTVDLFGCRCDPAWLTGADRLAAWCSLAFEDSGLGVPSGINREADGCASVGLMAAGVHLCLHAQARERVATLDVFVADVTQAAQARALADAITARLMPEWTEQRSLDRGEGA